jgi:hypothetical protein
MGVDWGRFSSQKRRFHMKSGKIFARVTMALLSVTLCTVALAQDHATAQEVVAKVREAASTLSKTGDLAQFNQNPSQWVWKDSYIFVFDCDKNLQVASSHQAGASRHRLHVDQGHQGEQRVPERLL